MNKEDSTQRTDEKRARQMASLERELDRQGAPPSQTLDGRLRALVTKLRQEIADEKRAFEELRLVFVDLANTKRRRLPDERDHGDTHHFVIFTEAGEVDGYLTHNRYEDGTLGEIFVRMGRAAPEIGSLLDNWAIAVSIALQYGVPLEVLVSKFVGQAYEPSGLTKHPAIRTARSVVDYVVRYLRLRYLPELAREAGDVPRGAAGVGTSEATG